MPNFACCLANMHQGWPKFTESLWMATNDNGLIAVAYSPCVVKAKVGKGQEVTIHEETNYPFNGSVKFRIKLKEPARFPVYLRVPGWADSVVIAFRDKTFPARQVQQSGWPRNGPMMM